jgi:hypothetical protein
MRLPWCRGFHGPQQISRRWGERKCFFFFFPPLFFSDFGESGSEKPLTPCSFQNNKRSFAAEVTAKAVGFGFEGSFQKAIFLQKHDTSPIN